MNMCLYNSSTVVEIGTTEQLTLYLFVLLTGRSWFFYTVLRPR